MPFAEVDGIRTRYEVRGDGPTLLLFSPGGFNATLDNWSALGVYQRTGLVDRLAESFRCILFDRREAGESGGRVERVGWADYARQGLGLLDHLGIDRAHLMGGCVGCSIVLEFARTYPARTRRLVLYSPAGGVYYRRAQHARLARHAAYAAEVGLAGVVARAKETGKSFNQDPAGGPWAGVLRADPAFAHAYVERDLNRYLGLVSAMSAVLFDTDTVPGPAADDLLLLDAPALVVPGDDASHALSAAHHLRECLPNAEFWDATVAAQTGDTAPARVAEFLAG